MEIIISANQNILAMANRSEINIGEDMSEKEFWKWVQGISKEAIEDENRLQEVSI